MGFHVVKRVLPLLLTGLLCVTTVIADPDFPKATPVEVGLDDRLLDNLVSQLAAAKHDMHSMLLLRRGQIVVEEYYNGYDEARTHDLRSATKSITSLLIGIAIDRGDIRSIDDPFVPLVEPRYPKLDLRSKRHITLRHLLTMRSGLDCDDGDRGTKGQEDRMYRSRDWLRYFLSLDEVNAPGSVTRYCTGGVVALGAVLESATGMNVDMFADEVLFAPLGITNREWAKFDRKRQIDTGGHLELTPRGMAAIGQLVLDRGVHGGRQLVSETWLEESTRAVTEINGEPYAYLWWPLTPRYGERDVQTLVARGNGGQTIMVVPEFELVFVTTSGYYNKPQSRKPLEFLYNAILPSVCELQADIPGLNIPAQLTDEGCPE